MNIRRRPSTHDTPRTATPAHRFALIQQGPAIRLPERPAESDGPLWLLRFAATSSGLPGLPGSPAHDRPWPAKRDLIAPLTVIGCLQIRAISPLAVRWIRIERKNCYQVINR